LWALGLTSQSVNIFGGYKAQGRGDAGQTLLDDALALERHSRPALVLECVPVELAQRVTDALSIPVIGIGAGNVTDGQILGDARRVWHYWWAYPLNSPNSLARRATRAAVRQYIDDAESGVYPGEEHSFH
jgi:3-methyl-2-oxobutanoate hydroxymethyltransferase